MGIKEVTRLCAWVAQSVQHPTLDLGSGHDLMISEIESHVGLCAVSVDPAWDSLLPSLSLSLTDLLSLFLSLCVSLKINKNFLKTGAYLS